MKATIATGQEKLPWAVAWAYKANIGPNNRDYVSYLLNLEFQVLTKREIWVPWVQNAERETSSAAKVEPPGQLFPTVFVFFIFYVVVELTRKINCF